MRINRVSILLLFITLSTHAVDIGSDTAVTRFNTQQIVADGDRIAGFAGLDAGFAFANPNVTGIFDSFFAVSGDISLSFGTLVLNQNLVLNNDSSVSTAGTIVGAGHSFVLSPSVTSLVSNGAISGCSISFLDSISTGLDVNALDWNASGEYIAVALQNGGNELQVYSWDGTTLTFITGVNLGNDGFSIAWHPTNDWIAVGRDGGGGADLFNYSFNGTTLTLLSSVDIGGGAADLHAVRWRPQGDFLAVGSDRNTRELNVFPVNGSGVFGTPVIVNIAPNQDVNALDWDDTGLLLGVGCDTGGNELRVYTFTTVPTLVLESSVSVGQAVLGLSWNKVGSNTDIIAIGLDGGVDALQLYRHTTGTLTQLPTALAISDPVNSVDWHPNGFCLAAVADNGALPDLGTLLFANDTLLLESTFELGTDVLTCRWSRGDGDYLAIGDSANDLSVYKFDTNFLDTSEVEYSDLELVLNNDVSLLDTSITFSGECVINGRNNVLSLNGTATLVVEEGASLLLQNITVDGVAEDRIRLLDSQSTLSVEDATFILEDDFSFNEGSLDILGNFTITGTSTFSYTTNQQAIIRGGRVNDESGAMFYVGSLIIDHSLFYYAPVSSSSSLLVFESELSSLKLISSTLQADTLSLITGSLLVEGYSYVHGDTMITLGSGTESGNVCVQLLPAAHLDVIGTVEYANV